MKTKIRTKTAMVYFSSRYLRSDRALVRAAAAQEGLSVSEFFRVSIRERARRVLLKENDRAEKELSGTA